MEPVGWPPPMVASGQVASHIKKYCATPQTTAGRMAMPKIRATPMPNRPSINNQSTQWVTVVRK